jgi:two-component system chemotaxis response regulator CheY
MRFLVVDDSSVDRQWLVSLLQELGHQVDELQGTEGALEQIAAQDYSVVFLDIVMPNQDGYKFLRSLRANQATAQQRVVFCSSKATKLEIDYGVKRAGADAYLTKPVTREALSSVIQQV